ncbi:MAG: formylglycine-generating enzyme family protein [Pseudomonadota bacterium]
MCPEMVAVEAGSFLLGSPPDEAGRVDDEGPQQLIAVGALAVSRFEITVGAFSAFAETTGYEDNAGCYTMSEDGTWRFDSAASWQNPGFPQEDNHPVVCVTWNAANAYVAWLNQTAGVDQYRLLSESEWEYSARGSSTTTYWWGVREDDFCQYTNGVDQTARSAYPGWQRSGGCDDGHLYTAPVGSYGRPNGFGLEDMVGNVWEWVADCYVDHFRDHPGDGSPVQHSPCEKRVMRGGAWGDYGSFYLRSAYRGTWKGSEAFGNIGFRVARTLDD